MLDTASNLINVILIVVLFINLFAGRDWKRDYKEYREDARKIKQDYKEIKRDNKLLTVHTKKIINYNEELRKRLLEIEEG